MNSVRFKLRDFLDARFNIGEEGTELERVLSELPRFDGWVAGGAVRDTILNADIDTDIDMFFTSQGELLSFETDLLDFRELKAVKKRKTVNNTTYEVTINDKVYEVQLINVAYYESASDLIDTFDFTVSQFAIDDELNVTAGVHSMFDLARKRLVLHKLTYGVSTVRRLIKYSKKGYYACAGTITSILQKTAEDPSLINEKVISVD